MKWDTFMEHKETIVVCEENGPINISHNALLITPKMNVVIKPIVHADSTKSTITCTNYGKIGDSVETYHNNKKAMPIALIVLIKSIEPIVGVTTQPTKPFRIPLTYPYTICSNINHWSRDCPEKHNHKICFEQNWLISIIPKLPKTNNVPINVIVIVITWSQIIGQIMRYQEPLKV